MLLFIFLSKHVLYTEYLIYYSRHMNYCPIYKSPTTRRIKNTLRKMALRPSNQAGRRTAITDIHPEIIETHILTRLDVPTLASAACASRLLNAMCMNEKVWTDICNSTWTSTKHPRVQRTISTFPGGHRSFFSDSFPILHHGDNRKYRRRGHCSTQLQTSELISAVDIHYKNKLVYSEVDVTNTGTNNFYDSTFQVELLDQKKESVRMPVEYDDDEDVYLSDLKENMTLSWIVIDPTQKRAANVSSLRPVRVRPHWIDGDIEVKYATMVAGDFRDRMSKLIEFRIVVKLVWKEGGELHLRKVNLQVLDMDSNCLSGKDSLGILQETVRSGKRKKGNRGEETERYRKYVDMKRERREGRQRRGGNTIISAATTIFLALVFLATIFWLF